MAKRIFIAATGQNDGKTTLSMGLIEAFKKRGLKIGFIKPIGQRYLVESGYKVDEDSVLIEKACRMSADLKDMSPIAIEKGFTENYILCGKREDSMKKIISSFERIARGKDLVVIEGTGHAGVGSVCDWSNASVARLLQAKVILIASGGIGRPIDEIMLNKALFDSEKVKIIGTIINKVRKEKYKKVSKIVRLGLARKELSVLGVMPYVDFLSTPTVRLIKDELRLKVLCGEAGLGNNVRNIIVGAMEPHDALNYITEGSLIITPGDREDIILASLSSHMLRKKAEVNIAGLILTGGLRPQKSIFDLLRRTDIPTLVTKDDTYSAASKVHDLIIKVQPQDKEKIAAIIDLVEDRVDVDKILKYL